MTLRRDAAIAESPPCHALIAASICAGAMLPGHSAGTPAATTVAQDGPRQTASQAYSLAGIWETDPQALPPDAFLEPRGLDVDPCDGPVYVVDGGNRRVEVYRSDGTHVRAIGGPGRGPDDVLREARRLHEGGVRLCAIGLGPDIDSELLSKVVGDRRRLVLTPDAEELQRIYSEIARDLPCLEP